MKKIGNKGFTLIELIAVVVLMAIIAVIATPNVVNMVDKGKKEQFVLDAKELISLTKYQHKLEKYQVYFQTDGSGCSTIKASLLGVSITEDPDGNYYDLENSSVKVCLVNNKYVYSVKLLSKKKDDSTNKVRGIGNNTYVNEEELTIDSVVVLQN